MKMLKIKFRFEAADNKKKNSIIRYLPMYKMIIKLDSSILILSKFYKLGWGMKWIKIEQLSPSI